MDTEILEEAIATSEIFRHCALIYLYRVVRGDKVDLDARTRESLDEVPRTPFIYPLPCVVSFLALSSVSTFIPESRLWYIDLYTDFLGVQITSTGS